MDTHDGVPTAAGRTPPADSPRVAYLLKKFPRLSETFVLGEILAQEALGRRLHVFSRRPADDEPRHARLAELRADVELVPRARALNPWAELFQEDAAELLERVRRVVADEALQRHVRFNEVLAEAIYLRRRTRALGVEHLHVHFATDAAVCAAILKELGGPTYSVTAHAKDIYRETVDRVVLDRILSGSAFTVTVCDANVEHVRGLVSAEAAEHLRRLYNGVDLDEFELVGDVRRPAQVLAVGRLVEKKGFDVFLEAAARTAAQGRDLEFVVAGAGEEQEALEARARELGVSGRVRFTGAVDQTEVRRLMAESTVLALPCRIGADGNRDALPTVLLEALACGLPCVSTPVSGVGEILAGVGEVVPSEDPEAIASAVLRLIDDPEERKRRALLGRNRAEELFDRKSNAQVLFGWFEEALEEERRVRVAHVNSDPGIAPGRAKGAAVHVDAVRRALTAVGADVVTIDAACERVRERLAGELEAGPLDLIYERYALGAGAAQAFACERGVPYVLEVNSPLVDEELRFRGRDPGPEVGRVEQRLFEEADVVLAVSRPVAEYVLARGGSEQRVWVRPNAVDPERFDRERSRGLRADLFDPGDFVVGFHGRLRPWHGFERIAAAVADLRRTGVKARLLAVGEGDFEEALGGLEPEAAVLAGWQPHAEVGRWVGCFDALPLAYDPSAPCYFSPLKLREAMAAGVVPIVPDLGDLAGIVETGRTGLLVTGGDPEALVGALRLVATDAELRARMSRAAQAEARRHTWRAIALELVEFARAEACR